MNLPEQLIQLGSVASMPFFYWNAKAKVFQKKVDGLTFMVRKNTSDMRVIQEVFDLGSYSHVNLKPTDTVLDIGANIGAYTLYASRRARQVISYEPFMENFDMLKGNVEQNDVHNVKLCNMAVGGKARKTVVHAGGPNFGTVSLYASESTESMQETQVCSLEEVFSLHNLTKVDVLKLDVEGAEYEILMENAHVLSKIDRIILEFHDYKDLGDHRELIKVLKEEGFVVEKHQTLFDRFLKKGIIAAYRQ